MQQKDPKEITDIAIQMGELERDFDADTEKLRADILAAREAGDDSLRRKLRKELEEKEKLKDAKLADLQGKLTLSEDMMMTMSRDYDSDVDEGDKNKDDRWKGYSKISSRHPSCHRRHPATSLASSASRNAKSSMARKMKHPSLRC
ncbi:MAG: hypothetical protein R3F19_29510 [Verrucomicrobiales bacterium]